MAKSIWLDPQHSDEIRDILQQKGWLGAQEPLLSLTKPGEGNMNLVLRVQTPSRTFILKQARPWVEKYPQIPAPIERLSVEHKFYRTAARKKSLAELMPAVIGYDKKYNLLLTEDLGKGADYTHLYRTGASIATSEIQALGHFLTQLHRRKLAPRELQRYPENRTLRLLNHEHIFNFPYSNDTGFDLDTIQIGLQEAAQSFRKDGTLLKKVKELGNIYLSKGATLLHGDYYPGSWLKVAQGVRIIDPEFSFLGPAEFDAGVMMGHVMLSHLPAQQQAAFWNAYSPAPGFDTGLAAAFAGTEMLRRIIGLAQLPLQRELSERKQLLEKGRALVLGQEKLA